MAVFKVALCIVFKVALSIVFKAAVAVSVEALVFIVIGRSCSEGCRFDSHYRPGSF